MNPSREIRFTYQWVVGVKTLCDEHHKTNIKLLLSSFQTSTHRAWCIIRRAFRQRKSNDGPAGTPITTRFRYKINTFSPGVWPIFRIGELICVKQLEKEKKFHLHYVIIYNVRPYTNSVLV